MVQLCGLHTTVTLLTHGPSTPSLCVQPCGHTRTRSRCLVVTVLTVILWSHVVTCGHDAGHCVYVQSPCHMWSHVNTAPSHSCYIATCAYTWMGHPVTVCSRGHTWLLVSMAHGHCVYSRVVTWTQCLSLYVQASCHTWSLLDTASAHCVHSCRVVTRGDGAWSPCVQLSW